MSEAIDRFRYRFELWRRERHEYSWWGGKWPELSSGCDRTSYFADQKRAILLKESTVRSIGRTGLAYFGVIIIVSQILFVIGRLIPSARFALGIVFLVFLGVWTLGMLWTEVDLRKARKEYRQQQDTKSSNQAMQRTAGRSAF